MAEKITLEAEIKSNIKQLNAETAAAINSFGAFGITVGVVKDKFIELGKIAGNILKMIVFQTKLAGLGFRRMFSGQIIKGAKNLFSVIAAGITATGIGALLIAFTSLITYLTRTEKGAEKFRIAMAGVGAVVDVVFDRIAAIGKAIVTLFSVGTKEGLKELKEAFSGIGTELVEDVKLITQLQRRTEALRDSERDLSVETAQRRAEIEKLKLIAEDVTKTEEERLEAAQQAFDIEQDLLDKRVENAEEAVRIAKQRAGASESSEEDLDNIRDKEVELANIQAESATKSIELNNKINAIKKEQIAKNKELAKQAQDELDMIKDLEGQRAEIRRDELSNALQAEVDANEERERNIKETIKNDKRRTKALEENEKLHQEKMLQIYDDYVQATTLSTEDFFDYEQQLDNEALLRATDNAKARREEEFRQLKEGLQDELDAMALNAEDRERLQGKLDAKLIAMQEDFNTRNKLLQEANVANTVGALGNLASAMSSLAGDNKELAIAAAIMDTYAGANKAYAQGGIAGIASAAAIVVAGLANVNKIMQTDVPGRTSAGSASVDASTPAPEFFSGSFDLQGAVTPEQQPLQAFVLTDEMTNSQNQLANIRRRATI
jgi:hypothetical protein